MEGRGVAFGLLRGVSLRLRGSVSLSLLGGFGFGFFFGHDGVGSECYGVNGFCGSPPARLSVS